MTHQPSEGRESIRRRATGTGSPPWKQALERRPRQGRVVMRTTSTPVFPGSRMRGPYQLPHRPSCAGHRSNRSPTCTSNQLSPSFSLVQIVA